MTKGGHGARGWPIAVAVWLVACGGQAVLLGSGGAGDSGEDDATSGGSGSGAGSGSTSGVGSNGGSGGYGSSGSIGGGSSGAGTSSGTSSGGSASGAASSSGSSILDGSVTVGDAAIAYDAAPVGLAGVAFVVNGRVQSPMSCPAENWAYPVPSAELVPPDSGSGSPIDTCTIYPFMTPCSGLSSVLLLNTGQYPVAYTAGTGWGGSGYPPGVNFGETTKTTGVLAPGARVEIVSIYQGSVFAVVGSSAPFSNPDAGKYVADEGTIPWPTGVSGSQGAAEMHVAELEIATSCGNPGVYW